MNCAIIKLIGLECLNSTELLRLYFVIKIAERRKLKQ